MRYNLSLSPKIELSRLAAPPIINSFLNFFFAELILIKNSVFFYLHVVLIVRNFL